MQRDAGVEERGRERCTRQTSGQPAPRLCIPPHLLAAPCSQAAWHPVQPVCALLAPHELLLVAPTGDPGAAAAAAAVHAAPASSDSEGEDGAPGSSGRKGSTWGGASVLQGDWGQMNNAAGSAPGAVLLALQGPAGSSAGSASGRCCLAWLDAGPSNGSGNGAAAGRRRLVVSWGGRLELLVVGSEGEWEHWRAACPRLRCLCCIRPAQNLPSCFPCSSPRPLLPWLAAPRLQAGSCTSGGSCCPACPAPCAA